MTLTPQQSYGKHRDTAHMTKEANKRLILSFLREDHAKLQQIAQATELSRLDVLSALEALESEGKVVCPVGTGYWQLTTN